MNTLPTALQYLRQGISVIPSDPKTKQPLFSWKEYQAKLPTEQQVKAMWTRYPNAMVSIITGQLSGILVVDCDSAEAIKKVEDTLPDSCEPIIAVSPRGGRHYYWQCKNGKWQSKNSVIEHIDIKANGGVIVAAPSRNDKGGKYTWLTELSFDKSKLQEMPLALSNILINTLAIAVPNLVNYQDLFVEGRRDNDLFDLARHLKDAHCPPDYVLQVLTRVAVGMGNEF